ncbi:MAG: hypothetical protein SGARI_005877, partial [Bacillariaceae sp.]
MQALLTMKHEEQKKAPSEDANDGLEREVMRAVLVATKRIHVALVSIRIAHPGSIGGTYKQTSSGLYINESEYDDLRITKDSDGTWKILRVRSGGETAPVLLYMCNFALKWREKKPSSESLMRISARGAGLSAFLDLLEDLLLRRRELDTEREELAGAS